MTRDDEDKCYEDIRPVTISMLEAVSKALICWISPFIQAEAEGRCQVRKMKR